MPGKAFLDTNVVVYAFADNDPRGAVAEDLLGSGGAINVQVLNEFVNVSRRKLGLSWDEIDARLEILAELLDPPAPLTVDVHEHAVSLARAHSIAFYDALIVAAALQSGATTLWTEDMQDGWRVEGLEIRNPFLNA